MDCVAVYKCLCDSVRLRILNLLSRGPLCVCHVQQILDEPQPKISKQLAFMKRNGLIESTRHMNWTIYRIPEQPNPLLAENLKCLQELAFQDRVYKKDLKRFEKTDTAAACIPAVPQPRSTSSNSSGSACSC